MGGNIWNFNYSILSWLTAHLWRQGRSDCANVYMHTQNPPLVHLDLKPANVLVSYELHLKVESESWWKRHYLSAGGGGNKACVHRWFWTGYYVGETSIGNKYYPRLCHSRISAPEQLIHGSVTEKCVCSWRLDYRAVWQATFMANTNSTSGYV